MQLPAVHKALLRAIPREPLARAFQLHRCAYPALLPEEVVRFFASALLLLFLAIGPACAQGLEAFKKPFNWGDAIAWDAAWNVPSQGTEVLDDRLEVRLKNLKPRFLSLFFERRKVIRFTSEDDIARFASFTLPESLDPPYDGRWRASGAQTTEPRPHWFNVRLDELAARIIRPDGTWGEVGAFANVDRELVRTFRTMETAWTYVLDLQAISPGDVVEVRWKYMVPYDVNGDRTQDWRGFEWMDNWSRLTSWRVFFHGDLPVRKQQVTFRYHAKHGLGLWSEEPFDIQEDGDERTARWELRDLPACISEVNARPGADLPHIRVKLQCDDGRYWTRDRLSGMPYVQPYWLYVLRWREQRALWWRRVAMKNVPDRQNKLFREFVERTVAGIPAGRTDLRMRALHNTIAERFTYAGDSLWYENIDQGMPKYGDQVNDGRLREISRYDLYAKLVYAVKAGYSTAYLMDDRIGSMDDRWMTPLWDNDIVMGVKAVDGVLWMHPKRSASGEWANELPFYWQGSSALVMDPVRLVADGVLAPLFVQLPELEDGSNQRVREFTLNVNTTSGVVEGEAQVLLSGQFSTLGRGAYAGKPMDPTVLPAYGDPLKEVDGDWTIRSSSDMAPFRFQAHRQMDLGNALKSGSDSSWSLNLGGLLAHAVPHGFNAKDRDLPFYWDFEQEDRVVIDLRLDSPMEFETVPGLEVLATTSNARIERRMTFIDPYHLRIESSLIVSGEREQAQDFDALEQLLRAANASDVVLGGRPRTGQP